MGAIEEKQIEALIKWVNVRIAPSEIHGVGLFALKDIPEGTELYLDLMPEVFKVSYKKLKNNVPSYIHDVIVERWPHVANGSAFVYPDARYVCYMNHSDNPNYDPSTDRAIRDIKAGEEITENYKDIEGWEGIYPFLV